MCNHLIIWYKEQDIARLQLLRRMTNKSKIFHNPFATWFNEDKARERRRQRHTAARQRRRVARQERREAGEKGVSDDSDSSLNEEEINKPHFLRRIFESRATSKAREREIKKSRKEKKKRYLHDVSVAKHQQREKRRASAAEVEEAGGDPEIISDTTVDISSSSEESIEIPGFFSRMIESRLKRDARDKLIRQNDRRRIRRKKQTARARIRRNHDKLREYGVKDVSDTPPTTPTESSTEEEIQPGLLHRIFESRVARARRESAMRKLRREKESNKRKKKRQKEHNIRERRRVKGELVSDTPPYVSFSDDYTTSEIEEEAPGLAFRMFASNASKKVFMKRQKAADRAKRRAHRDKLRRHRNGALHAGFDEEDLPKSLEKPILSSTENTSSESEDHSPGLMRRLIQSRSTERMQRRDAKRRLKLRREAKKERQIAKAARAEHRKEDQLKHKFQINESSSSESSLSSEEKPGFFSRLVESNKERLQRKNAYNKKIRKHDRKIRRKKRIKERQRLQRIRNGETDYNNSGSSSSESSLTPDEDPGIISQMFASRNHQLNEQRKHTKKESQLLSQCFIFLSSFCSLLFLL